MHIQGIIEKLGFTASQAKIYLAALRMGEASISELAEKAGLPRTTATQLAEHMQQLGLLNSYSKRGKRYWSAENPDRLLVTLGEREAALKSILPSLHGMRAESDKNKPNIRVYEGVKELKLIFDDIIATHHHVLSMISWEDIIELMDQDFLDDYIDRRFHAFLKVRLITPRSPTAIALKKK